MNYLIIMSILLTGIINAQEAFNAEKVFARLSLREKIAQLLAPSTASSFEQPRENLVHWLEERKEVMNHEYIEERIKKDKIGGLLLLFDSTAEQHVATTNKLQAISEEPLLMIFDAENGLDMRLWPDEKNIIQFPRQMTIGAIGDEKLWYEYGNAIGRHCMAIGVHFNCAPVLDVNSNPNNPIIWMRSLGENPVEVARRAVSIIKGMQRAGVLTCGKHWPGHGDTNQDSHEMLPEITRDKKQLEEVELMPFKAAIENGVDAIMTAHLEIPSLEIEKHRPSSLSRSIVTDLLQKECGFKGLVITDSLEMSGVTDHFDPIQAAVQAFIAGNDILLDCNGKTPADITRIIDAIEKIVTQDSMLRKQLDASVMKILTIKETIEIHKKRFAADNYRELINNEKDRDLKRQLYRAAITLLRNNHNILPLKEDDESIVSVVVHNHNEENTLNEHLKSRLKNIECFNLTSQSSRDELQKAELAAQKAQTIICSIFGITRNSENNYGISSTILEKLQEYKDHGKKIIVAPFGNPYCAKLFETNNDALIIPYEDDPDTEEAVADVIVGQLNPSGKLPITASEQCKSGQGLSF